jgi:hypothetical protein
MGLKLSGILGWMARVYMAIKCCWREEERKATLKWISDFGCEVGK